MHDNLNRKKQEKPRNSVKESKKSCHQHHHRFSFVQKCTHYRKEYYCCPPYATKGGIRSLLFEPSDCPHASSVEEDTSHSPRSSSFHWPLPFHFHLGEHLPISSKYLSNLIGDRNHNISWDSLGNSHCFNASFHQTQTKGQSSKKHSESITSKSDCTAYTYPCSKSIDPQVLQNTINMVKSHNDSTDTVSMQEGLENGVPGLSALLSFLAFEDESPAASTGKDASTHHNPQSSLLKHNVAVADQSISSVATGSIVTNTNTTTITTNTTTAVLEKATIVYHESARSIVFRDHLRRAHKHTNANANRSRSKSNVSTMSESSDVSLKVSHDPSCSNVGTTNHAVGTGSGSIASSVDDHQTFSNGTIEECDDAHSNHNNNSMDNDNDPTPTVIIANYTPQIDPLPPLELEPHNEFSELLLSNPYIWNEGEGPEEAIQNDTVWLTLSDAEKKVVDMLLHQKCAVKTIKNADLTAFISKFPVEDGEKAKRWMHPIDFSDATKMQKIQKYKESDLEYHSFFTSLSLLPSYGLKMRCYGSTREYPLGVVFELEGGESEDSAAKSTHSWSWPAGYAAKTEYNIAMNGALINGREEALVPISHLRKLNHSYIYDRDYEVLGKIIKGGFNTLPYNELYCRIGGSTENARSFDDGLGLPVAIFARTASFGDLTALLRLRARLGSVIGKDYTRGLPLLLIDQDMGTRVLSDKMQQKLLSIMSNSLNPFQNPHLKHRTKLNATSEKHFQQKLEELLDLDDENIRNVLTAEECARLAGGFGASDESVARLLMDAMIEDHEAKEKKPATFLGAAQNKLQNIVNEGLTAAVRSGDFNTSRQLLILYTLVASRSNQGMKTKSESSPTRSSHLLTKQISSVTSNSMSTHEEVNKTSMLQKRSSSLPPPPPPPPLDTDRLRSATNSDGLLAVLGAAEVLKSLQSGDAKSRVLEAAASIDEWVEKSEHSVAFRLASWRDLTAAQDDLKIATEGNSKFMAFVSNKAINNRTRFAEQLRHSVEQTNFESIEFLKEIHAILGTMHSPCLRLELLQFILGLDNRYSVAHVARSVELAATCLNISASEDIFANEEDDQIQNTC